DIGAPGTYGTFSANDQVTFLQSPPPEVVSDKNRLVAARDGSFWIASSVDNRVYVTRDRGTTWQRLTTVDSATGVGWVATADGRTVYAFVRSGTAPQLVRSTDGGTTWSTVLDLPWPTSNGLALPNGDLLLVRASAEGGTYRLDTGAS